MIDAPHIAQTVAQQTAIIRLTIPRAKMMTAFGPAVGELMSVLAAQGISPAGPVFAHHLKITPGIFDFEVGVAIATPVIAAGRMKPSEWPAMKVARTGYRGPYEGLPDAGHVHGMDRHERPRACRRPLGMLRHRPASERRSRHVANRTEPSVDAINSFQ